MAGRLDASRDLRLGLFALESGAIDQEQLVSAVRSWARSRDRSLSAILAGRGLLDAPTLARLEDMVARNPESPESRLASGPEPTATFDHAWPNSEALPSDSSVGVSSRAVSFSESPLTPWEMVPGGRVSGSGIDKETALASHRGGLDSAARPRPTPDCF